MGNGHVLWADWLGTTPGREQFVVREKHPSHITDMLV